MDYLMKLTWVILTINVLSVSVKTRKCAVWNFKSLPTLFQFSYQSNQLFNLIEKSTKVSAKLETVEALKQNPEIAPKESSPAILFSNIQLFLGLFLNSPLSFHIKAHQNKEHTWNSRFWIAIEGIKNKKDLISRNHKSVTMKMPAPFKTLHFDFMQ